MPSDSTDPDAAAFRRELAHVTELADLMAQIAALTEERDRWIQRASRHERHAIAVTAERDLMGYTACEALICVESGKLSQAVDLIAAVAGVRGIAPRLDAARDAS